MIINIFLTYMLSLIPTEFNYYTVGNRNVSYFIEQEGKTLNNIQQGNNYYEFSTGINSRYILNTSNNLSICEYNCAFNDNCLGIYYYSTDNTNYICNELSNLGSIRISNTDSYSLKKISITNFNTDNNILGYVYDTHHYLKTNQIYNTTIYLDLNHNALLDENEPSLDVESNKYFTFENLTPGLYSVREIPPHGCSQILPGNLVYVNGYEGDGYPDIISKYVNYGHNQLNGPFGGFVNSTILQNGNNNIFNYILNNDTFTYMTFYNNYSITIGFTDESIVNTNGSDIFLIYMIKVIHIFRQMFT